MTSQTDPMGTVRQYIDYFNKGDVKAMGATCDVPMSILDGLPPHAWHGPTACEDWHRDVMAAGEREGATGYIVTLCEPWHADITCDRAYVVVPSPMTFKVHGQPVTESGSSLTVGARKLAAGWRITAWAWAKGAR